MSLMPSSLITKQANPGKTMFPNLARHRDDTSCYAEVDAQVKSELEQAGIKAVGPHEWLRENKEVPAAYIGELCMWGFKRAWYYWVAEGPGIPPDKAQEFWEEWGTQVRTEGHGGCPSPLEYRQGFAVSMYHIDTLEGLVAFADLLRSIYVGGENAES